MRQFQKKCLGKMGEVARGRADCAVCQPQHGGHLDLDEEAHRALLRPVMFAGETGSAIRHYLNEALSVELLYVDGPVPPPMGCVPY